MSASLVGFVTDTRPDNASTVAKRWVVSSVRVDGSHRADSYLSIDLCLNSINQNGTIGKGTATVRLYAGTGTGTDPLLVKDAGFRAPTRAEARALLRDEFKPFREIGLRAVALASQEDANYADLARQTVRDAFGTSVEDAHDEAVAAELEAWWSNGGAHEPATRALLTRMVTDLLADCEDDRALDFVSALTNPARNDSWSKMQRMVVEARDHMAGLTAARSSSPETDAWVEAMGEQGMLHAARPDYYDPAWMRAAHGVKMAEVSATVRATFMAAIEVAALALNGTPVEVEKPEPTAAEVEAETAANLARWIQKASTENPAYMHAALAAGLFAPVRVVVAAEQEECPRCEDKCGGQCDDCAGCLHEDGRCSWCKTGGKPDEFEQ